MWYAPAFTHSNYLIFAHFIIKGVSLLDHIQRSKWQYILRLQYILKDFKNASLIIPEPGRLGLFIFILFSKMFIHSEDLTVPTVYKNEKNIQLQLKKQACPAHFPLLHFEENFKRLGFEKDPKLLLFFDCISKKR